MKTLKLQVIEDFEDGDLKFKRGQIIDVDEKHHTVYIKMGVVKYVEKSKIKASKEENEIKKIMEEKQCDKETAWKLLKDREERNLVEKTRLTQKKPEKETKKEDQLIGQHYQNKDIKNAIIRHSTFTFDSFRCLNGDFSHWYKSRGENVTLYDGSNGKDYDLITSKYRTLYWSLNFFHPNVKLTEIPKSLHDEQGNKISIGNFSNTNTISLGIDIDAIGDITKPKVKKAVEQMAQFYCTTLKKYCPKSVYTCFSGGGVYVYIHHGIFMREFQKDSDREISWRILAGCYNTFIKDLEEQFFKKYPQHKGKVKADAINNQKRVFKTVFSVHKTRLFAVVPLNVKDIHINFEDATLPLSKEIIGEGRKWMQTYDANEAPNLMARLKEYEDTADIAIPDDEPVDVPKLSKKAAYKFFSPCIKKIINTKRQQGASKINGATRMKTLIAIFLGQAGYSREGSLRIFKKVSNRLGGPESNIFESWFQKMHCPSCKKIRKKGGGFPHLHMGELNICKPDKICKHIDSPYEYLKENAKFGSDESTSATSKRLELLETYGVFETKEDKKTGKLIKTGKINCPRLADIILNEHSRYFFTMRDNKSIFFYNGGHYEPNGDTIISNLVEYYLDDQSKEYIKNEVIGHIRDKNYVDRDTINPDVNLINLENGTYNIETRELLPHSPKYRFLNKIPIKYDPEAKCPLFEKFLQEVCMKQTERRKDIEKTIQEYMGYTLHRSYRFKKYLVLDGSGDNGKTVLLIVVEMLVGKKNNASVSLQDLNNRPFALSKLYGKLANISDDLPNRPLKYTGVIKQITGNSPMWADIKNHKDGIRFTNIAKPWFACNQLPESYDWSDAFFSRMLQITLLNKFVQPPDYNKVDNETIFKADTNLIEGKCILFDELPGILNFALDGLHGLLENNGFSSIQSTDEIREEYIKKTNPVHAYIDDECERTNEDWGITKDDFYNAVLEYCELHGYDKPNSQHDVTRRVNDEHGNIYLKQRTADGERQRVWLGVRSLTDSTINHYFGTDEEIKKQEGGPQQTFGEEEGEYEPEPDYDAFEQEDDEAPPSRVGVDEEVRVSAKSIFTKAEENDIKQIIKKNPDDNYTLLTSKYGEDKINKAIEAGIFIESILGKKLNFSSSSKMADDLNENGD